MFRLQVKLIHKLTSRNPIAETETSAILFYDIFSSIVCVRPNNSISTYRLACIEKIEFFIHIHLGVQLLIEQPISTAFASFYSHNWSLYLEIHTMNNRHFYLFGMHYYRWSWTQLAASIDLRVLSHLISIAVMHWKSVNTSSVDLVKFRGISDKLQRWKSSSDTNLVTDGRSAGARSLILQLLIRKCRKNDRKTSKLLPWRPLRVSSFKFATW